MNTEAHHGLVVSRAPCSLGSLIFILISSLNLWHGQFTAFRDVPTQSFLPQSPSPAWCLRRGPVAAPLGVGVQGSGAGSRAKRGGTHTGKLPGLPVQADGQEEQVWWLAGNRKRERLPRVHHSSQAQTLPRSGAAVGAGITRPGGFAHPTDPRGVQGERGSPSPHCTRSRHPSALPSWKTKNSKQF